MTAVFIISAPSGSGKSTLVNNVRKLIPDLEFSVSYTTRAPRGNEQNGREYFFISRPEFEARIDRKSTRLNSSHVSISYAVFCLKKKKHDRNEPPFATMSVSST